MRNLGYTATAPHLAYMELGEDRDTPPIVYVPGLLVPIALMDADPGCRRFLEGLASIARVIAFDRSGVGYSDSAAGGDSRLLQVWADDLIRLLDDLQIERCIVVASVTMPAGCGVLAAVAAPERVDKLVLLAPTVRAPSGVLEMLEGAFSPAPLDDAPDWPSLVAPTRGGDPAFRDWWLQIGRVAASPTAAEAIWRSVYGDDLSDDLPCVGAETLVLCRDSTFVDVALHHDVAAVVPEARLVALPGNDLLEYAGDVDALTAEIATFCTGAPTRVAPARELVTILMTDMVGSTDRASATAPDEWRGVLDHHDEVARRAIARFGGSLVKQTGDGVLATFDAPSRAIRAALELRDELDAQGIAIRSGIHLGEVDRRGDDIAGLSVHLAARIMSTAAAGEIRCSAALPVALAGAGVTFVSVGPHTLKGVDGEWELWSVAP